MSLNYRTGILLFLISKLWSAGVTADLNCNRLPSSVTTCPKATSPYVSPSACKSAGCFYCDHLPTKCVEGIGCSWNTPSDLHECRSSSGRRIFQSGQCRERPDCSWCQGRSRFKCVKNPTSPDVLTPDPKVCASQTADARLDCRTSDTEVLTATECVERIGCTWCPGNSAFKCVRGDCILCISFPGPTMRKSNSPTPDIETPPQCIGNETLPCFPHSMEAITENQCHAEKGCAYCAESGSCMRAECPDGFLPRDDGKACCKESNEESVDVSWLVRYEAGSTSCKGFVVSPDHVITAGTCLTADGAGNHILGTVVSISSGASYPVGEAHRYPNFINTIPYHDLMLLKTAQSMPSTVQPLSLPLGERPPADATCYVISDDGTDLAKHPTTIQADADCLLKDEQFVDKFQLCAQSTDGAPCPAVPGSPIVCQRCKSCASYAYGITSYTLECFTQLPTYFTKFAAPYIKFLEENGVELPEISYSCDT